MIYLFLQITFPPNIYYKIFTHRPVTDLCANSPKDYNQLSLIKKPEAQQTKQDDRSGWYQRMENNSWRLFCSKVKTCQRKCSVWPVICTKILVQTESIQVYPLWQENMLCLFSDVSV